MSIENNAVLDAPLVRYDSDRIVDEREYWQVIARKGRNSKGLPYSIGVMVPARCKEEIEDSVKSCFTGGENPLAVHAAEWFLGEWERHIVDVVRKQFPQGLNSSENSATLLKNAISVPGFSALLKELDKAREARIMAGFGTSNEKLVVLLEKNTKHSIEELAGFATAYLVAVKSVPPGEIQQEQVEKLSGGLYRVIVDGFLKSPSMAKKNREVLYDVFLAVESDMSALWRAIFQKMAPQREEERDLLADF